MFKDMQNLLGKLKQKKVETVVTDKHITPILSADALLSTEKRSQLIQEMRALLGLPDAEFDRLFLTVLNNYAEFVQNIPETERSYYAGIGGMLDHALERTALSLFLCRTYLLPEDTTLASLPQSEMLWLYAVFTGSLLLDVGKIATRHVITLTDEEGKNTKIWMPYTGPMVGQATHYIYGFNIEHYDHLRRLITPLLARQVLPPGHAGDAEEEGEGGGTEGEGSATHTYGGFNWIASDPDVLESWLGLLSEEQRQIGSIMTVIPLADAQLMEGIFTDRKIFRHSLSPKTIALLAQLAKERKELAKQIKELREKLLSETGTTKDIHKLDKEIEKTAESKVTKQAMFGLPAAATAKTVTQHSLTTKEIAARFVTWLQQNLEKQSISVNKVDSPVQRVNEGVLLTDKVFKDFIEQNKHLPIKEPLQIQQALNQTEIAKPTTFAQLVEVAKQTGVFNQAMLVQNPYLVFPSGVPPLTTNVITTSGLQPHEVQRFQAQMLEKDVAQARQDRLAERQETNQNRYTTPTPTINPRGR